MHYKPRIQFSKEFLLIFTIIFLRSSFSVDLSVKESQWLDKDVQYMRYEGTEFPLIVYVIIMPMKAIDIRLLPAIGQREEVSLIATRSNAFIAINGSNYRRGGKYNGNRVNLFYLNGDVYSDLQFIRGSFAWSAVGRKAIIDKTFLNIRFFINDIPLFVNSINQPRVRGQAVLYTHEADTALLFHTPGTHIIINNDKIVEDVTSKVPDRIPQGWYIYQVDEGGLSTIEKGVHVLLDFEVQSACHGSVYNDYNFVLGGAGLLIQDGKIVTDQLYDEFSEGSEVVHTGDEIVADFHARKMQEWLITLRHPRTAIGITKNNSLCIVVVDGRLAKSEGLTLPELALVMKKLSCVHALNIGGGGCSTLWVNKKVVNSPSSGEERPVSEALCFTKINDS